MRASPLPRRAASENSGSSSEEEDEEAEDEEKKKKEDEEEDDDDDEPAAPTSSKTPPPPGRRRLLRDPHHRLQEGQHPEGVRQARQEVQELHGPRLGPRTSSGARTPGGRPWSTPLPVTPAHFSYPPPPVPLAAPSMAVGVTTLTSLAGLLSMGALTQAEFDAAKERVMVKHGLM